MAVLTVGIVKTAQRKMNLRQYAPTHEPHASRPTYTMQRGKALYVRIYFTLETKPREHEQSFLRHCCSWGRQGGDRVSLPTVLVAPSEILVSYAGKIELMILPYQNKAGDSRQSQTLPLRGWTLLCTRLAISA